MSAAEARLLYRAIIKEGKRCPNYNIRECVPSSLPP